MALTDIFNILDICAYVLGSLCVIAALLLYPDERNNLQNRLEARWVKLHDIYAHARSRQLAVIATFASIALSGFHWLFGRKLFSWQFFTVSACTSIAGLYLILILILEVMINLPISYFDMSNLPINPQYPIGDPIIFENLLKSPGFLKEMLDKITVESRPIIMVKIVCVIVVAIIAARCGSKGIKIVWLFFIAYIIWYFIKLFYLDIPEMVDKYPEKPLMAQNRLIYNRKINDGAMFLSVLCSVFFDQVSIFVTIYMLNKLVSAKNNVVAFSFVALDILAVVFLFLIPVFLYLYIVISGGFSKEPISFYQDAIISESGAFIVMSALSLLLLQNLTTILPTLMVAIIAIFIVAHLLIYPSILRPIYYLVEAKVFSSRKTIGAIGIFLLTSPSIEWKIMIENALEALT